MTEVNKKIIELISKNKSMKEICNILNLSEKQLYIRIKQIINYGYLLKPNYLYNSDICYTIEKDNNNIYRNRINIEMPRNVNLFRCLVISDTHIGSVDSNIKLLDIVYDYAVKNGINIILNCGDSIEGDYTSAQKNIKDLHSQLEYFIKKYPYDKSIKNFMILGNHDYHSLHNNGLDISTAIKNSRYDIIPIGYGQGNVNVKNDNIILFHKLYDGFKPIINGEKIVLSGHSHMMKTKLRDIFWIGIPTLSYQSNDKTKNVIPGFVDLSIDMENNRFEYAEAKHLIICPEVIQVSEVRGKVKNLFNDNRRK
ncbi:MAG: metallophosphoesterase family protein [Bacilli bacterium]|nr:metallophosphoesterase family protein [Bacilli bacterium]